MIGNTSGFPVGIPLGVDALLWSRNLETPARVRRQPLGPAYALPSESSPPRLSRHSCHARPFEFDFRLLKS
jgi:hypothetical protein